MAPGTLRMNCPQTSPSSFRVHWHPIYTPFLPHEINALAQVDADGPLTRQVVGNWVHPDDPTERIRFHNFWDVLVLTLHNSPCLCFRTDWEELVEDFVEWLSFSLERASQEDSSLGEVFPSTASERINALLASIERAVLSGEYLEEIPLIETPFYLTPIGRLAEATRQLLLRIDQIFASS